jgi:hypothetical protein
VLHQRKSRLIDQRWKMLSAESARMRQAHHTSSQGLAAHS